MESGIQRFLLIIRRHLIVAAPVTCLIFLFCINVNAQESELPNDEAIEDIVKPDIERRRIQEDKIDSENWELGVWGGILNVEDFGSNNTLGLTAAYHVSEDFFVEAQYGQAQASQTSFDRLSGGAELLNEEERELSHIDISLGFQLQSEVFLGSGKAFNSNFYLIGGVGYTDFGGNEYFTSNLGAGVRVFLTDFIAARVGFRNYVFSHSLLGNKKRVHNLEGRMGVSIFF